MILRTRYFVRARYKIATAAAAAAAAAAAFFFFFLILRWMGKIKLKLPHFHVHQHLAAAGHAGRGPVYVSAHSWIRLGCVACVCFTVPGSYFVSCCNLPSYHTNGERRTNTMSRAIGFRKQPHSRRGSAQSTRRSVVHNRSRIQQQLAALRQPLCFVEVTVTLCVLFVCIQSTPQC